MASSFKSHGGSETTDGVPVARRSGGSDKPAHSERTTLPPARTVARIAETMPDAESFGVALRAARERAGLTQTALAHLIERSTSLISLLESGQRRPTRENVGEISRALGLTGDEEIALFQAGGFTSRNVQGAVQRIVDVITNEMELDDADSQIFQADLTALIHGWRTLFTSARQYQQGNFEAADTQLTDLAAHLELSPTLHAYGQLHHTATLTQLGRLKQAEELTRDMRRQVEDLDRVRDWAPALRAEVCGTQGMLAVRLGQYQMARALIAQSAGIYERMLTGTPQEKSIGYQGLGRSNKRLAELSLFEGQPAEAFRYCVSAEAYLRMAHATPQQAHWLRRTNELKAWALAELGDFTEADLLRESVAAECRTAGDVYGLVKNALYVADDYCRRLKNLLHDAGLPERCDPADRRRLIQQALGTPEAIGWLDKAEEKCREALAGLEQIGQRVLLGQCLRTLGTLQHFRAIMANDATEDETARETLDRALTLENAIGQERRIPATYETLAETAWNRGDIPGAVAYFTAVLQSLDHPLIIATDVASNAMRGRANAALNLLTGGASVVPGAPMPRGSEEWQALTRQLIETVHDYIQTQRIAPLTHSDRDPLWLERMAQLDCDEGRRVLAQDKLSASLALALPAGYVPEAADIHQKRFYTFEEHVRRASDPAGRDLNHDLCCRPVVERGIANPETRSLVREQVRRAAAYMESPRGYLLDAGLYTLPLAFAVKRDRILVEVPAELAMRFTGTDASALTGDSICYAIQDASFARALNAIFGDLVDEARRSVAAREATRTWAERALDMRSIVPSFPY